MSVSMTNPSPVRAAERRGALDQIGALLLHADVLDGQAESGATWATTTEADRQHYRARARRERRQNDPVALTAAMHEAKKAAFASLPAGVRMLLTDEGRKHVNEAIEAAIAAHSAQMLHGREEQEERLFEQIHDIPSPRAFAVIEGGKDAPVDDGDQPYWQDKPLTGFAQAMVEGMRLGYALEYGLGTPEAIADCHKRSEQAIRNAQQIVDYGYPLDADLGGD